MSLVSGDARGTQVVQKIIYWLEHGVEIHAPALASYEVANGLTRLIVANAFPADQVQDALNEISLLPIIYHFLEQTSRTIEIALTLGRQSAYDAAYIALTEALGSELWTLDGPLYRNASEKGFPVRLLS